MPWCHLKSVYEPVAATSAAHVVTATGKNRRPAIHGSGGHGAGVQPVIQRVNLSRETLGDQRILVRLRFAERSHVHLVLQTDILTLCLGQLVLHAVQLELAELVDDGVSATGLGIDDVPSVLGSRRPCRSRKRGRR